MKVIIIGGGPAGMCAAISAKKRGNEVVLIEKTSKLGNKLKITGKGRCNITSSLDEMQEFINNTPGNGKFLHSAFNNFSNKDILKLLNIPTKVERGNRIFPVSDNAQDVVDAFIKNLKDVQIVKNTKVIKLLTKENHIKGVETDKGKIEADKVVLATGGMSYPGTGSTGDGYKLAKEVGHTITEIKPSLVGFNAKENCIDECRKMQGLTLKNVGLRIFENNKKVYEDFGEMLFTHFGVSGPIIISASAHLVRTKMINAYALIDLKPALKEEQLNDRLLRDFEKYKNKNFKNSLDDLLPQKMINTIIKISKIEENKKTNEVTKIERLRLVKIIKNYRIDLKSFRPIEEAIITSGGISIKEINPKTMESKIIKGLFFAGEVIDVDAYTGGFNLQIAYSTGYTAGMDN